MTATVSRLFWFFLIGIAFLAFGALNAQQASAEEGLASWYGPGFVGSPTASGEPYDPGQMTAAHKTLPLGTVLDVSYGGKTVQVTVNDRGPYVGARELDLSQAAAESIGLTGAGVDYVTYSYAGQPASAGTTQAAAPDAASNEAPAASSSGGVTNGGTYTISSGDTLHSIAAELGTSAEALAQANGIENPDMIYAGETLSY